MHCPCCDSLPSSLPSFAQNQWFGKRPMAMTGDSLHALFISAFPKLPCACSCSDPSRDGPSAIAIDINDLDAQPYSLIWHPTCIRTDGATAVGRPRFQARRSVSASRLSESAGFLVTLRDAIKFYARPGVPEWSKTLPQLGGSQYEPPSTNRPALGRSSCYAGPCADHLV